jgi:hypothetical protein
MQWPTEKDVKDVIRSQWTDNAMANRKRCQRCNQKPMDRQCNGQQIKMSNHWLLITSVTSLSVGHCIVCPLASDYIFDIFICWPLHCLSIGFWLHLWHLFLLVIALSVHWLLITSLTSFSVGHCIVCPLASDYIFDIFIFWPRKRCQRCIQKPMDRQCNGQQKKMSKM